MARPSARFARQFCAARRAQPNSRRRPRLVVQTLEDRTTPATFVVTSAADSGTGTLRDAIDLANGAAGADTIVFDTSGVFATPQTIDLLGALPAISNELTIQGTGAANLTVQRDPGAADFRIFTFNGTKLTLSGFTATNGVANNANGGGLLASSTVVLDGMKFSGNSATGTGFNHGSGGGVALGAGGSLTVRNSTISGNTAAQNGGGIYFYYNGSLQVLNSTISGNTTTETTNSKGGGGIYLYGYAYTFDLVNTTIANNTSASSGGAIALKVVAGNVAVVNCTISGNAAQNANAGQGGGGIATLDNPPNYSSATLNISNTIISGNSVPAASNGPDILSALTVNVNYSALQDPTDGFTLTGGNNLTGSPAALGLGSLADNGGPTLTEAPAPGSPLIDAGSNALIPTGISTDQRSIGFLRTYPSRVDIGSVEVQPPGLPFATASAADVTTPSVGSYTVSVTYLDPNGTNNGITAASVNFNDAAVRVTGPNGFDVPATFAGPPAPGNGTPITVNYSFTPPGGGWDGPDSGDYQIVMQSGEVFDQDGNAIQGGTIGSFTVNIQQHFVVTTTDDSGPGSLRDAIDQANAFVSGDLITFDPAVFSTPQTIALQSSLTLLATGGALTIAGPGAADLTVDGGGVVRVLDSQAPDLTLSGFAVTDGLAIDDIGGGLKSSGNVTLDHMVFSGNAATGSGSFFDQGCGGAVALVVGDGLLRVVDSTISGNTAEHNGGGIFFRYTQYGSLLLEDSTVSGNTTTYSGNYAGYFGGGGIFLAGRPSPNPPPDFIPGAFTIRNSTIANNSTSGSGGGIFGNGLYGGVWIQDSTISGNTATAAGAAPYPGTTYGGGGFGAVFGNTTLVVLDSVVSGNTNAGGAADIQAANPVYLYYSAVGDGNGFTVTAGSAGNLSFGIDPMLGPLQDNGGPTQTMAPLAGSPLLNAGNNGFTFGLTRDQRGLNRLDPATGLVDIGAVEAQAATVTIAPAAGQANPTNNNTSVTFTVVFDQPVTGFGASGIDLTGSTATGTLTANVTADSPTTYTVTVSGISGDGDVVAAVKAGTSTVGVNATGQPNLPSAAAASVTVDTTRPTVTINKAAVGQNDPTNSAPVRFDVQFSEAVSGFDASDVTLISSIGDTLVAFVSPGGPPNSYVVTVSGMTGSSLVTASIAAGAASDAAGNLSQASTSTDNTIDYDVTPPTVTVNQAAGQADPAGGLSVAFDVVFSEKVAGFDGSDIDFTGTTAPGALVATISGTGPAYTVTITGMTGGGTVVASIDAGAVTDLAGNPNEASTGTDNSITYVHSGVVQFSSAAYSVFEQGAPQLTVTVQRTGGSDGPLDVHYATADGTALAGSDYTAVAGNFHWDAGDTSDRTFAVPVLDDGGLEADSAFTVNLTNISLPGALGTPATATVNIFEEAALAFSAPTFNTAESDTGLDVVAHVTVSRQFGGHGSASVDYTITAGTATAGADYTVGATTGTLFWADGDTADKTIDVTIKDDNFSEGKETINLALSNPTGNALLGGQTAATLVIAHSEGKTILGTSKTPLAVVTDPDGDLVTLKLSGKVGSLVYYETNDAGPISEVDLVGTESAKSVVSIAVKKPRGVTGNDGRTTIGEVDGIGTAGARSLSLGKADLVGDGLAGDGIAFNGYVGSVTVGDVKNGADITLNGTATTPRHVPLSTRITAGQILGTPAASSDITVAAPLASLTAIAVGNGTITAPSVGAITVKGRKATKSAPVAIPGDFESDLTIAGTGLASAAVPALRSLRVAGSVIGSTIKVASGSGAFGNVGSVSVGSFVDSRLFAGYSGPDTGDPALFNLLQATVGSFTVRAVRGQTNVFDQSFVIASNFKSVSLASVPTAPAGPKFGFVYHSSLKALSVKTPPFKFNPKLLTPQDDNGTDFEVKKV